MHSSQSTYHLLNGKINELAKDVGMLDGKLNRVDKDINYKVDNLMKKLDGVDRENDTLDKQLKDEDIFAQSSKAAEAKVSCVGGTGGKGQGTKSLLSLRTLTFSCLR